MTIKEIVQRLKTAMDDARGQESHFESWLTQNEGICDAIDALKELDKTEQEPVAWMNKTGTDAVFREQDTSIPNWTDYYIIPLYTTPPQRKPLTDEEIRSIENKINPNMRWRSSDEEGITLYPIEYYELVRAIEAAHGIKE